MSDDSRVRRRAKEKPDSRNIVPIWSQPRNRAMDCGSQSPTWPTRPFLDNSGFPLMQVTPSLDPVITISLRRRMPIRVTAPLETCNLKLNRSNDTTEKPYIRRLEDSSPRSVVPAFSKVTSEPAARRCHRVLYQSGEGLFADIRIGYKFGVARDSKSSLAGKLQSIWRHRNYNNGYDTRGGGSVPHFRVDVH